VDVERRARVQHVVGQLEDSREVLDVEEAAAGDCMKVCEVEHGPDPRAARRDREDVLCRTELAHTAHDLDPERNAPPFRLEALAQLAELLADCI